MTIDPTNLGETTTTFVVPKSGGFTSTKLEIIDGRNMLTLWGNGGFEIWEISPTTHTFIGTTPIYRYASNYAATGYPNAITGYPSASSTVDGYDFQHPGQAYGSEPADSLTVVNSAGEKITYWYTYGQITDDPYTTGTQPTAALQVHSYNWTTDTFSFNGYQYGTAIGTSANNLGGSLHFDSFQNADGTWHAYTALTGDTTGSLKLWSLDPDTGHWNFQQTFTTTSVPATNQTGGEVGNVLYSVKVMEDPTTGSNWMVWDNSGNTDWSGNFTIVKLNADGTIDPTTARNINFFQDIYSASTTHNNNGAAYAGDLFSTTSAQSDFLGTGTMKFDSHGNLIMVGTNSGIMILDPDASTYADMFKASYDSGDGAWSMIGANPNITFTETGEIVITSTYTGGGGGNATPYSIVLNGTTYAYIASGYEGSWGTTGLNNMPGAGAWSNSIITLSDGTSLFLQTNSSASGATSPSYMSLASTTLVPVVVCFVSGTKILTDRGERAIETLTVGDLVLTLDHGYQPIRWINRTTIGKDRLTDAPNLYPIRVRAGALGKGMPKSDLYVSRQHRLLVKSRIAQRMFDTDEVLIPAIRLTDLDGIDIVSDCDEVTYHHFLFDQHEIVMANGAAAESLYTGPEALRSVSPEAREEILTLFPQLLDLDYKSIPARPIPTQKEARRFAARHAKNHKPPCEDASILAIPPQDIDCLQMLPAAGFLMSYEAILPCPR